MVLQKMLCPRVFLRIYFHFFCKNVRLLGRSSVSYLSLSMWCTENLLLLHDLYLFCCFLVKSQVTKRENKENIFCQPVRYLFIKLPLSFITTENLLFLHLYHFFCLLIKSLVTKNCLPFYFHR